MVKNVCTHCKRPTGSHYKITKFDAASVEKGSVVVCSLLCLINWAYNHGTAQGVKLASDIKGVFQQLLETFKGPST